MGMGKTRLHNELCSPDSEVGKSVVKAMEEVGKPVRFIRFAYNEDFSFPPQFTGRLNSETFWKQLLCFHGLNAEEAAKVKYADNAVRHIRDKLDMQAGTTLVVCVDELMKMPCDGSGGDTRVNRLGRLIRDLVVMQDHTADTDAPIVFLFSAVDSEMFDSLWMATHRQPQPAKLPRLSEDQLQELLFNRHPHLEQFKEAPMFVLLLKLCAPTPRYALEGLPHALKDTKSLKDVSAVQLLAFLQAALDFSQAEQYSESDRTLVEDTVRSMLQGERLTNSQTRCLADKGWLCTASNGKPSLHPMVLRAWATEEGEGDDTNCLPVVLSKMFRCDFEAASKGEPFAEEVFIYFEQARRLSLPDGARKPLTQHYPGGNALDDFTKYTSLTVPKGRITEVENFTAKACRDALDTGSIVVCKKQNEQGVECIFPFHYFDTVWCGVVQVRLTDKVPSDVGDNMFTNAVTKQLGKDSKYKCFGILFSTQQDDVTDSRNVCSLNAESLVKLMEPKVGPLRVLYEKRLPSASVLASRPVWPATLSQSPTRTSAMRWVPFLRSII